MNADANETANSAEVSPRSRTARRRRFATDIGWNLAGTGLPLLAAVMATPRLVEGLGAAKFGVLTLAWVVVGYFSLFDLGLGRAMTQLVAEQLGRAVHGALGELVWTGMWLMSALGVLGGLVTLAISPLFVEHALEIPRDLVGETRGAFLVLALSVPLVIVTTGLRGILEGCSRFDWVNAVRIPLGAASYLAPWVALNFTTNLTAIVGVLVAVRAVSAVAYLVICVRIVPELRERRPIRIEIVRRLMSFGGWMTVSNITGPLLLYLGRFIIAVRVSAEAVAYFSTPYDALINLLTVPAVLVAVLFPAFAGRFQHDRTGVATLYRRSQFGVLAVMAPVCAAAFVLARPILEIWINADFAENGYRVAQWLAVGIFINSFGHVSQAVVQASGRPDVTAKLHLLELAMYVPYLLWLVGAFGIVGAAIAWVIRVAISTCVLVALAERCLSGRLRTGV